MTWNPETYLAFAGQRTRPAADLLARVPASHPARVIDLGCGPGNSTALLAARWPDAGLEGLDSSADMLKQAKASSVPANWILAEIAAWTPQAPYDVIFSNATFQWLPDQAALFPRLMSFVKSYQKSDYGLVPWRERAEVLRKGMVARVPPMRWSPDDGRAPK